eukprot:Em0009g605a
MLPGTEEIVIKDQATSVEIVSPDELVPVCELSGIPKEQLLRVANIYKPSANAMQSGTDNTHYWCIAFDTQERWENPLMGWTSSADPLANLSLKFDTKNEAIAFAVKSGWQYEVEEPHTAKFKAKSYAANFSWDKKTRVATK